MLELIKRYLLHHGNKARSIVKINLNPYLSEVKDIFVHIHTQLIHTRAEFYRFLTFNRSRIHSDNLFPIQKKVVPSYICM